MINLPETVAACISRLSAILDRATADLSRLGIHAAVPFRLAFFRLSYPVSAIAAVLHAKVMAIMLIEIWERLRGYDKWVQTEATIKSSTEQKTEEYYRGQEYDIWSSDDELTWTDTQGAVHSAEFGVPENSPLFQLIGGETVTIRYDPKDPDSFYYPDLLRSQIHTAVKTTLVVLVFVIIFGAFIILRIASSHSR